MLINFSVENFRSFGSEQTLNLISSAKFQDHPEHLIPIAGTKKHVLKASVIYGANAAGKSNLVRAMSYTQRLILGTVPLRGLALNQFRFSPAKSPSAFEFRFSVSERIFVYGFQATHENIVDEWLEVTTGSVATAGGRETEIFHRSNQEISIGDLSSFGSDAVNSDKTLEALKQLGVRRNQLLLTKLFDLDASRRGKLLDQVVEWFRDCLKFIQPQSEFNRLIEYLDIDPKFREFSGSVLSTIGTGVSGLQVDRAKVSADRVPKQLLEALQGAKGDVLSKFALKPPPGESLQLNPNDPTTLIRRNLSAKHTVENTDYFLPFKDQSDGTQRCLQLMPALYRLTTFDKPTVFVIDEMDRSLHPLLSHSLIKFFVESCPSACQQMILTTHETHLLDQELLRRDEIWFVEKDEKLQSQLYSLADFNVRNDVRIEKGYLQGRYGGIPFIGDQTKLRDLLKCSPEGEPNAAQTAP